METTSSLELARLIASAAERLLAEHGPKGVTHRAVAREAGVSVNSIANRFGSIDALLDHVALRGFVDGRRRFVELNGEIQLTLAGLAFSLDGPGT